MAERPLVLSQYRKSEASEHDAGSVRSAAGRAQSLSSISKQRIADQKRAKVQRAKAEQKFLSNLSEQYDVVSFEQALEALPEETVAPESVDMRIPVDSVRAREVFQIDAHVEIVTFEVEHSQTVRIWTSEVVGQVGQLVVREAPDFAVVRTIPLESDVTATALLVCREDIWVGLSNGVIRVYTFDGQLVCQDQQHSAPIANIVGISNTIFTTDRSNKVVRWEIGESIVKKTDWQEEGDIGAIVLPESEQDVFIAVGSDIVQRNWEGAVLHILKQHHEGPVIALVCMDDQLFSASKESVRGHVIGDPDSNKLLPAPHMSEVQCLSADIDTHRLIAGDSNGNVNVWDTHNMIHLCHNDEHEPRTVIRAMIGRRPIIAATRDGRQRLGSFRCFTLTSRGVFKVWYGVAPRPRIEVVKEFSGFVRCLEITQGGATIWSGEQDGTVAIRSGLDGHVVCSLAEENKTENVVVDSLYATEAYMWVGLSNGTVQIYDALMYIRVADKSRFHHGPVTAFAHQASMNDDKVYSASADTMIIKWDEKDFDMVNKMQTEHRLPIKCVTLYGYNLFSGGDDCVVRCMDTETGQPVTVAYEGHTAPVTCLLVLDGYLFSSSEDSTVRVWNIVQGVTLKILGAPSTPLGHKVAVTCMIGDPVAHKLWSGDADGIIHVWNSLPENDFHHAYKLTKHAGSPLITLKSFLAIDAIKAWSLSSNSINKVWYGSSNKIEATMTWNIDAMRNLIDTDQVTLAKWKGLIEKLQGIDSRRREKLAATLGKVVASGVLRQYYLKWLRFHEMHSAFLRKQRCAQVLLGNVHLGLRRPAYWRWLRWASQRREKRGKNELCKRILANTHKALVIVYWKKLTHFKEQMKRQYKRHQMVAALNAGVDLMLLRVAYRKFSQFRDANDFRRKRLQMASAAARTTDAGLRRTTYFRWLAFRVKARSRKSREQLAERLRFVNERQLVVRSWAKWTPHRNHGRVCRARAVLGDALRSCLDNTLRATAYRKLAEYAHVGHMERKVSRIGELEDRQKQLDGQEDAIKELVERRKVLDAALREVEEAKARRQKQQDILDKLKNDHAELLRLLEEKKASKTNKERSLDDALKDLMGKLKAYVINFDLDWAKSIEKTRDRLETIGFDKGSKQVFKQTHIEIKRIILGIKGTGSATDHELSKDWTLSTQQFGQLDKLTHVWGQILQAVKILVVSFDFLPVDKSSSEDDANFLETKQEIVANAETLKQLVDYCRLKVQKR